MKSDPAPVGTATRRRLWLLLLPVAALLAVALALRTRGKSGSEAILERMRAAGYPTTLAELDAWYPAVPDAENAALVIVAAAGELTSRKDSTLPIVGTGKSPARGQPWDAAVILEGREYLDANQTALARLMSAAALPRSRYPVTLTNGFYSKLGHLSSIKGVAQTLALKSAIEAEEGHAQAAAESLGALFETGRSLENEPQLISHLVRIAIDAIGLGASERVVNRVELPDTSLAELQASLFRASTNRALERTLAGEACMGLDFFRLPPAKFAQAWIDVGALGMGPKAGAREEFLGALYSGSGLKSEDERYYLHVMERMIAAAKVEAWESEAMLDGLEQELINAKAHWYHGRIFSAMLVPGLMKAHDRDARHRASLRSAMTGLAVERFRHAHAGQLPESLADLVPAFLAAVPADPFTGQPLHFLRRERGYVVYSFGPDKDDDGGKEFRSNVTKGDDYDVTFTVER